MKLRHWSAMAAAVGMAIAGPAVTQAQQAKGPQASSAVPSPDGPWIGTWKRQAPKSGGRAGEPAIMKMWVEGDGFRYEIHMGNAHMSAFARFDGKQYPEKGNAAADFNVFKRVDDHTYSLDDIKNGKVTHHFTVTISADGKTRTSVHVAKNEKGEEVTSTGVWDRVK